MENSKEIAKYLLSLDTDKVLFTDKLISLNGRTPYEGNVRLNKYLHIIQMVYMAKYGKRLFGDAMYAYDNGVIVEDVMRSFIHLKKTCNNYNISDENNKLFLHKMYDILKYAPLEDLIQISHEDEEWIKKHSYYDKKAQLMDIDSQIDNYKEKFEDFLRLLDA